MVSAGRPPGSTRPEERVEHLDTGLGGDVVTRRVKRWGAPDYAGDMAGTWLDVVWDDGFACSVPERSVRHVPC